MSGSREFVRLDGAAVTLVFTLKTLLFSMAVALIPMAGGLHPQPPGALLRQDGAAPASLARLFAVLLLIEALSLMGNYY